MIICDYVEDCLGKITCLTIQQLTFKRSGQKMKQKQKRSEREQENRTGKIGTKKQMW